MARAIISGINGAGEFFTGSYIVLRRRISLGKNVNAKEGGAILSWETEFSSFAVLISRSRFNSSSSSSLIRCRSFLFLFFPFLLESSEMTRIWREWEKWLSYIRC